MSHLRVLKYNGVIGETYSQMERVWSKSRVSGNCVEDQDMVYVYRLRSPVSILESP